MTSPFFLRISVRRLVVAACLALVVGFLVALFVYTRPAEYESTALIHSRQFFPPGVPDYELRPFADDVVAEVTDPQVAEASAADTGEPAADIGAGLEAGRVGDSGNVEVRYTSTDGGTAEAVVVAASHAALDGLAQAEADRAQEALERAEDALADATDATDQNEIDRAQAALEEAQNRVTVAQESIVAAASSSIVAPRGTAELSRLPQVLRGAVTGTVIAGALVLMIFIAVDRRRPARGVRRRRSAPAPPAPAWPDTPRAGGDR